MKCASTEFYSRGSVEKNEVPLEGSIELLVLPLYLLLKVLVGKVREEI